MISEDDKNNIKIFKYFELKTTNIEGKVNENNNSLEETIFKAEKMLKEMGKELPFKNTIKNNKSIEKYIKYNKKNENYEDILLNANNELGYDTVFSFSDILSSSEIESAYNRVKEIDDEFSRATSLKDYDLAFLAVATALQTLKWICLPEIGNPFDPKERMKHNDPSIEQEHKETLNQLRDEHYSKDGSPNGTSWNPKKDENHKKSWIEILYTKAPYDKIQGSAALDLGLSGANHRVKTLGHDPILGWIFGTANFMTDTATLSDLRSFRIKDAKWQNEPVLLGELFKEAIDLTVYDKHCLAAALVAQGAHLASDRYTKMGLPVPFLSTLSPDFASKLYSEHYDSLCLARDCKIITMSAIISILINMIISFVHGMFYNQSHDKISRELYEVRTRKILLISNTIASSSNIIYTIITKNVKKMDIGGILVSMSRIFSDIGFMCKIKEEFIQSKIDYDLQEQLIELDKIYKRIC